MLPFGSHPLVDSQPHVLMRIFGRQEGSFALLDMYVKELFLRLDRSGDGFCDFRELLVGTLVKDTTWMQSDANSFDYDGVG